MDLIHFSFLNGYNAHTFLLPSFDKEHFGFSQAQSIVSEISIQNVAPQTQLHDIPQSIEDVSSMLITSTLENTPRLNADLFHYLNTHPISSTDFYHINDYMQKDIVCLMNSLYYFYPVKRNVNTFLYSLEQRLDMTIFDLHATLMAVKDRQSFVNDLLHGIYKLDLSFITVPDFQPHKVYDFKHYLSAQFFFVLHHLLAYPKLTESLNLATQNLMLFPWELFHINSRMAVMFKTVYQSEMSFFSSFFQNLVLYLIKKYLSANYSNLHI